MPIPPWTEPARVPIGIQATLTSCAEYDIRCAACGETVGAYISSFANYRDEKLVIGMTIPVHACPKRADVPAN